MQYISSRVRCLYTSYASTISSPASVSCTAFPRWKRLNCGCSRSKCSHSAGSGRAFTSAGSCDWDACAAVRALGAGAGAGAGVPVPRAPHRIREEPVRKTCGDVGDGHGGGWRWCAGHGCSQASRLRPGSESGPRRPRSRSISPESRRSRWLFPGPPALHALHAGAAVPGAQATARGIARRSLAGSWHGAGRQGGWGEGLPGPVGAVGSGPGPRAVALAAVSVPPADPACQGLLSSDQ
mmetsp:Transcript_1458/g.2989  ORF Transcript_1458/g.2989 Transcript_1458/m.2989 type:complete len:238 (+) Transcript_1458:431-1144(+)